MVLFKVKRNIYFVVGITITYIIPIIVCICGSIYGDNNNLSPYPFGYYLATIIIFLMLLGLVWFSSCEIKI